MTQGRLLSAVLVAAAVLGAAPSVATAQAVETGFYLGAAFGQATANDFCDISRPGWTVNSCDEKASAWKIFGGYRFHRHFAAEATFIQTDEFSAQLAFSGVPVSMNVDAKAYGLAALGIWPVSPQFLLFGKLGIARTDAEAQATVLGQTLSSGEDENGAHYGVGAMFGFGRHLGVRAEWEKLEKGEFDMWSIGLYYRF